MDPSVIEQLRRKFPDKKRELPNTVPKHKPIDSFVDLRANLLLLPLSVGPGSGALRNEYLVALGERMSNEEIKLLEKFGLAYTGSELPDWFYTVWLTLQTVALFKNQEKRDVRPLGLRNSLVKLFHREVMNQSTVEIREYLEPVQVGMSKAGAAKLVFSVGGAIRANKEHIC